MPSCTQAAQFWGPELAGRGEARVNPAPSARDAPARPLPPVPESSTRARPRRDGQSTHNRQSNARPRSPPLGMRRWLVPPPAGPPSSGVSWSSAPGGVCGPVQGPRGHKPPWTVNAPLHPALPERHTVIQVTGFVVPSARVSGPSARGRAPACSRLPGRHGPKAGPARRTSGCCSGRRSSSGGRTAPGRACAGRSCRPSTGTCPPAWCPGRSSRSRAAAHLGSRAGSHWLQP